MLKTIIITLMLFPSLSYASYVNSCSVTVKLQEQTASEMNIPVNEKDGVKQNTLVIKGIVTSATESGRADSRCEHYVDNELTTIVTEDVPVIQLNSGSIVTVRIVREDGHNFPMTETVSFIKAS